MYQHGTPEFEHHVATYGPQNKFGYKDFIPKFRAEKFDAARWAELFRRSGAIRPPWGPSERSSRTACASPRISP